MKTQKQEKNLTPLQVRFLDLLNYGEDGKRSRQYCQDCLHIDRRTLQRTVKAVREKGFIVCSSTDDYGLWLEPDKKKFGKCIRQLEAEIAGFQKTIDAMKDTYKKMAGEDELFI